MYTRSIATKDWIFAFITQTSLQTKRDLTLNSLRSLFQFYFVATCKSLHLPHINTHLVAPVQANS